MSESIGEGRERKASRRRRLAIAFFIVSVMVTAGLCVLRIDPEESEHPMDIVQGTGAAMDELEVRYSGPPELEVRLDELSGEAWSIALAAGWIRNKSAETVRFEQISYGVRDEAGTLLWEVEDPRFASGFILYPMDYINFDIMPVCPRPATVFEIRVQGAEVVPR